MHDILKIKGDISGIITYDDGFVQRIDFTNTILQTGKNALARSLAEQFGTSYDFFITQMVFGDGGVDQNNTPKYVDASRNGLFGITRASKPVIATVDPVNTGTAQFVSTLSNSDAAGFTLSEMGLVMNNGDFYSMATFGGIAKTNAMQITWIWSISML